MARTLLLADDSPTIHRVVELTFAGQDMQVITADDGEQAIALIRTHRPDIILADIGMPKKTGYEVAEFVKQTPEFADIPVLLLAGAFDPVDDHRVEQTGCDGVLVKPFEPRNVIDRVRELLDGVHGSPTTAASAVPRPVERLAPPLDLGGIDVPASRPLRLISTPTRGEDEFTSAEHRTHADLTEAHGMSLDDYFDKLDAAFEGRVADIRTPPPVNPQDLDGASGTSPSPGPWADVPDAPDFDVFDLPPLGSGPEPVETPSNGHAQDMAVELELPVVDGEARVVPPADDPFAFDLDDLRRLASGPHEVVPEESGVTEEAAPGGTDGPVLSADVAHEPAVLAEVPWTPWVPEVTVAPDVPEVPSGGLDLPDPNPVPTDLPVRTPAPEPPSSTSSLVTPPTGLSAEALLADASFMDALATRVAERLTPAALHAAVHAALTEAASAAVSRLATDVVADTAERLIREEIERLTSKIVNR